MSDCVTKLIKILLLAVLPIAFTGCTKKAAYPNCRTDADCRIDAAGNEKNGICYMGKCEECAEDTDCTGLEKCVRNRCLSACLDDSECGANKHCENSYCVADCGGNVGCPGDQVCAQGRCIASVDRLDPNSWASSECQGLERVHFDFDKFVVKVEFHEKLHRVAICLEKNPAHTIIVEGNTDELGTPSYNALLGQKRAHAVKEYLMVNWGIAAERIKEVSRGEQNPRIKESNEYAWRENRRTEFIVER